MDFLGKRSGSPSSEAAICNRFIGKSRRAKRARRDVDFRIEIDGVLIGLSVHILLFQIVCLLIGHF